MSPLPARLHAKRILLRAEQGIGDILFFMRFAAELGGRGASIVLDCPPKVGALLKNETLFDIAGHGAGNAKWDDEIWTTDLPALLETEATPAALALRVGEARRERAHGTLQHLGPPPYLGLTWRAGTDVLRNREFGVDRAVLSKEISPELLGRAVRGWRGTVVSLQRGPAPTELDTLRAATGAPVHDLAAANEDLEEVLAILEQLDEYVAVSNTNSHLLAGLKRQSRVLVPHPGHWRWMREGPSVWFPGSAVYRQPQNRDWSAPLAQLREDLFTARI